MVADPPPRLYVVESMATVPAKSMVAIPDAVKVVSDEAMVRILLPLSRVRLLEAAERIDPAPTKVRESISRTLPSTDTNPASAPVSSIVIDPVEADTSNSEKLIAVAPPFIDVREVPLSVVVLFRFVVIALIVRVLPAPPLRGEMEIFPVLVPPIVRLCALVVPRLPLPVRKVALLAVDPAILAVGVPPATLMNANLAEEVDVDPRRTSSVILLGAKAPFVLCQSPTIPLVAQCCPEIQTVPVASGRVYV